MKLYISTILFWLSTFSLFSQIGINTQTPVSQSLLHIRNKGASSTDYSKDIVIKANSGNLGIGTNNPQYKFDINKGSSTYGLYLNDGNQDADRVLIGDADGVGTWGKISTDFKFIPGKTFTFNVSKSAADLYYYSGFSFQLGKKGAYIVSLNVIVNAPSNNLIASSAFQLKPTNNSSDWGVAGTKRFVGAYEVYSIKGSKATEYIYTINQLISSTYDNQMVYLLFWLNTSSAAETFTITTGYIPGNSSSFGSYTRIN